MRRPFVLVAIGAALATAAACAPSTGPSARVELTSSLSSAAAGVAATSVSWSGGTETAPADSGPQAVGAPDFAVAALPTSQTVAPPTSGTAVTGFLVDVGSIEGFTSPVALTVSGLPTAATAAFAPASVTPTGVSILSVSVSASTPLGLHPLTITGTSGSLSHSTTANLVVQYGLVPKCLVTVRGTATDAQSGAPIEGATVKLTNRTTATTADGSYEFSDVELGANNRPLLYSVTVTKDPPATNHIGSFWTASGSAVGACDRDPVADVALTPSIPANVTATVVEGHLANGQVVPKPGNVPVAGAGATIAGTATDLTDAGGAVAFVDNTGRSGFAVGTNNTLKTANMTFTSPSGLPVRQRYWPPAAVSISVAAGATQAVGLVPMVRQCTAKLTGTVRSATGAGIGGVRVVSRPVNPGVNDNLNVTTAADGSFTIPAQMFGVNNAPGKLELSVAATTQTQAKVVQSDTLDCGAESTVDINVDPIVTTTTTTSTTTSTTTTTTPTTFRMRVAGRVVDEETDAGIPGIAVRLNKCTKPVGGYCTDPVTTDAAGNYIIEGTFTTPNNSPTGATRAVTVLPASPLPNYWPGAPVEFELRDGVTVQPPDLKLLARRFGAVAGTVSDSVTGAPLAGATMRTNGAPRDPCNAPCVTGADGRYAFTRVELASGNAPKSGSVTASLAGYWPKTSTTSFVADTTSAVDLPLVKICPGGTVFGKVVNATTKAPIVGAQVVTNGLTATTDGNGAYELGVIPIGTNNAPVSVNVTASAAGFYTNTLPTTVTCESRNPLNFGFSPVITAVEPNSGSTSGGETIEITGTDLAGVTSVLFGTTPAASFSGISPSKITATSPPHPTGTVNIIVTTAGGTSSAGSASEYTFVPDPPEVTKIEPSTGPTTGGTAVVITGKNLGDAESVSFGGTPGIDVAVVSPTRIEATTPAGPVGPASVVVTTPGGSSDPDGATFTYAPPTTTSTTTTSTSTTSTTSTTIPATTSTTTTSTSTTSTSTTSTSTTSTSTTTTSTTTTSTTTTSTTVPTSTSTTSTSTTSTSAPTTTTAPTSTTTTTIKPPTTTVPPPTPEQVATVVAVVIWLVWLLFLQ